MRVDLVVGRNDQTDELHAFGHALRRASKNKFSDPGRHHPHLTCQPRNSTSLVFGIHVNSRSCRPAWSAPRSGYPESEIGRSADAIRATISKRVGNNGL